MNNIASCSILMCSPDFFDVVYEINAWMDKSDSVDNALATKQWQNLKQTYVDVGIHVEVINGQENLPDMVFSANGALLIDGKAVLASFRHPERVPESDFYKAWLEDHGYEVLVPKKIFEGEGDALFAGGKLYGGYGFRSEKQVYEEVGDFLGVEVITLELVNDRFYHLDTCLSIIDSNTVAFCPSAFSKVATQTIRDSFERVIEAEKGDAMAFGLNMLSTGQIVFVSKQAPNISKRIGDLGYKVVDVDVSEFKKAGGGIKCMSLFLNQIH